MQVQYVVVADVISPDGRQVTVNILTTGDAACDIFLGITPQAPYSITHNVHRSRGASEVIAFIEAQLAIYISNIKSQLANQNTAGMGGNITI